MSSAPTANLCTAGTASAVTGSGPWAWSCAGSNGGTTASCSAPLAQQTINGQCGSANGVAVSTAPTTNLCSAGTASAVTGSGPWAWNCLGSNGGTTACCSRPAFYVVNGQCGPMNGVTTNVAPTTGLCNAGTASAVSGSGPWTWSCAGSNGGTTASCEAFTPTTPEKPGPSQSLFNNPYYTCVRNFYVATNGSDCNNGTSSSTPWKTISHYESDTTPTAGDCINVAPGTYAAGNNEYTARREFREIIWLYHLPLSNDGRLHDHRPSDWRLCCRTEQQLNCILPDLRRLHLRSIGAVSQFGWRRMFIL